MLKKYKYNISMYNYVIYVYDHIASFFFFLF